MARRKSELSIMFGVIGAFTGAAYVAWLRPRMLTWGARPNEIAGTLPGDELITHPALTITRAVDISALPAAVWPFIAQLGRSGTGWYAFDSFLNPDGPSYTVPRQDLPAPQVGLAMDHGFTIARVESGHALIFTGALTSDLLADSWGSYAYVLVPHGTGTRLIARVRATTDGALGAAQLVTLFEPFDFVRMLAQLNGIKQRAEAFAQHTH